MDDKVMNRENAYKPFGESETDTSVKKSLPLFQQKTPSDVFRLEL